jgi:hypothetical protein
MNTTRGIAETMKKGSHDPEIATARAVCCLPTTPAYSWHSTEE